MVGDLISRRALLLGAMALGASARAWTMPAALARPALKVARPTQAVLMAITRAGRRLVAAGERGLILCSDDDGRSWAQAIVPVSSTLTALRFADERLGWAVGNMGVVLKTQDGGASWTKQLDGVAAAAALALKAAQPGPQQDDAQRLVEEGADKPFLDLALRPDGSLLVVGAYGLAFASNDKGQSWQPQMQQLPNPDGLSYYGLAERRGESLLFGEQGLMLRAAGPSDSFTAQPSPANGTLFGSLALREGPLLLLGLRGKAYRSAAPNEVWTPIQTPIEAALLAGVQLTDSRVLLAGAAGQLLLGREGGQRYQPLQLQRRFPFTGMAQASDGALLLTGMRGLLRLEAADLEAAARYPQRHRSLQS